MPRHQKNATDGFLKVYFSSVSSLLTLLFVCLLIALIISLINGLSIWVNAMFSFSFGVPISMIETFLRTRKEPMSSTAISIISVISGTLFGTTVIYTYIVQSGVLEFGEIGHVLLINFAIGFMFSAVAFYFFWVRFRNQSLTLQLREQQLKTAETENLRQQVEYRLLQSQMEPHFLFNTLANIQSLIDLDTKAAKVMIGDLSKLLRVTLQNTKQDRCSLQQELDLVRAYLGIQKVRIGERLIIVENVDEQLLSTQIPPMIIQPLIENCLKHGVEPSAKASTISLEIQQRDAQLVISITDNCPPQPSPNAGNGLSLGNIEQRLHHQYGDAASIISKQQDGGWHSQIKIPLTQPEQGSH